MSDKENFFKTYALLIVALLGIGGWYAFSVATKPKDETLRLALEGMAQYTSYSQHVETETVVSDRRIFVAGDYDAEAALKRYASVATTTLTFLDSSLAGETHSFALRQVAIGDDVYVSITTESALLNRSIPQTNGWARFATNAIPENFKNIAVAGPIMDTLLLFKQRGAYVDIVNSQEEILNGEEALRYTLALNERAFSERGKRTLGVFVERLGKDGILDIWLDKETLRVKELVLSNPPYRSHARFYNINSVSPIAPPAEARDVEKE